jgi:small neutral amino acid transporter SnatA (MarC family)
MKHCASTVIFSAIYIFFIFYFIFYFLFFTLLQLTTDLYASAVRGGIPLKDYGRKVF